MVTLKYFLIYINVNYEEGIMNKIDYYLPRVLPNLIITPFFILHVLILVCLYFRVTQEPLPFNVYILFDFCELCLDKEIIPISLQPFTLGMTLGTSCIKFSKPVFPICKMLTVLVHSSEFLRRLSQRI